jgi:hypothetical protein
MEPRAFAVLLQGLQEALGLEEWEMAQEGVARLPLESGISVEIDGRGEQLVLRSSLGVPIASGEESVMEQMLVGNLLGQQTGGGCLGVDERGAVLWKRLPEDLPVRSIRLELEDFSNYAEVWQKMLLEAKAASSG